MGVGQGGGLRHDAVAETPNATDAQQLKLQKRRQSRPFASLGMFYLRCDHRLRMSLAQQCGNLVTTLLIAGLFVGPLLLAVFFALQIGELARLPKHVAQCHRSGLSHEVALLMPQG